MDLRLSIILFVAISAVTLGAAVGLLWIMNRVLGKSPASRPGALPANSSRSSSTGPSCGRCGYSVRGATTLICPECGSDNTDRHVGRSFRCNRCGNVSPTGAGLAPSREQVIAALKVINELRERDGNLSLD